VHEPVPAGRFGARLEELPGERGRVRLQPRVVETLRGTPGREWRDVEANHPVLVCLLGSFSLLKHGELVPLRSGGKTEAVLTRLGLASPQGVPRETLLGAVWPDSEYALAGHALNTLVHRLRELLGDALGGAAPVVQSAGRYRLNHEAGITVDIELFKALVAQGDAAWRSNRPPAAVRACLRAMELYRGDLSTTGDENAHTFLERDGLRVTHLDLLMRLSDYFFAQGEFGMCLSYALQLLALDPCREDAHRLVMRCYVRRAERAQALRHYRTVQAILRAEFDAEPEPSTTALFEQVRLAPETV
jgi:DNA-binding SARP family transcriptional activator